MKMKSIFGGVVLIGALLIVGASLGAWKYRDIQAASNQPAFELPEFVEVVSAETESWQPTARLVGTVIAKRSVTLANEIMGVVAEAGFDSGDTVEQGQVLVTMNTSTEEADLAAAEATERLADATIDVAGANIRVAESNLSLAKNNHRRAHAATDGAIAATELDRIDADVEKAGADLDRERSSLLRAQAELDQARARAEQVRTLIAKKSLVAPFRARAGMRTVHPGQYLAEGTAIVDLTELTEDIYLDFAVPQEYASRVTAGAVVIARSNVLGSESVPITVVSIDATVNPTTRNVRVRSSVPNPGYMLKPGMSIDVEVPVGAAREEIVIAATAVRRAAFGDHVFTLVPGDEPGSFRAQQRMVVLGPDIGGRVIIRSGLKEGEQVAASGSFKLREGALVMAAPPGGVPPGEGGSAPAGDAH